MFKYGVTSGPYFPVFALNTRKYRPEITLFGHFSRSDLERQSSHRWYSIKKVFLKILQNSQENRRKQEA